MIAVRKSLWWIIITLMLCCLCACACADTTHTVESIPATLSLGDSYIVLTPNNLDEHTELLEQLGKNKDVLAADFAERGVELQAWVPTLDACLEVRVEQDEDSSTYYDLEQQTNAIRRQYRSSVLKGTRYSEAGYDIKSADWKRQTNGGRFLMIKYKRNINGMIYWGYARRTIRNGYTLTLDYQVYNRGLKDKDQKAVNKVANTVTFGTSSGSSGTTGLALTYSAVPPRETITGAFTVEGSCTPGAHLIGVVMRYSSPTPTRFETTAKKNGTFKMNVTLPEEGIWLMTLTIEVNGEEVKTEVFDTTTYSASTLPYSLDEEVPEIISGDTLVISGKTTSAVTVQCIVENGVKTFSKSVRTNRTGKFSFKVPSSVEADYNITLVLSKKGFDTRRFQYTAKREMTETDQQASLRREAIKPAYSTLNKKLSTYIGRVMAYDIYITDIQQSGDEWLVYGALQKTKKAYKNLIVLTCNEQPVFAIDSQHRFYGTCTGSFDIESEEGSDASYPRFDLLFWD